MNLPRLYIILNTIHLLHLSRSILCRSNQLNFLWKIIRGQASIDNLQNYQKGENFNKYEYRAEGWKRLGFEVDDSHFSKCLSSRPEVSSGAERIEWPRGKSVRGQVSDRKKVFTAVRPL